MSFDSLIVCQKRVRSANFAAVHFTGLAEPPPHRPKHGEILRSEFYDSNLDAAEPIRTIRVVFLIGLRSGKMETKGEWK